MAQPRVLLGFGDASDHSLEETAGSVLAHLFGNPIFPGPPVTEADFKAALDAFTTAVAATAQGGTQLTTAKNQARQTLIGLLRQLALFVQGVMAKNPTFGLAELLSTGFDAVSTNRAQHQLDAPNIRDIDNSGEGNLTLRIGPVANARQFEVQCQLTPNDQ